jgi:hypothetical protein
VRAWPAWRRARRPGGEQVLVAAEVGDVGEREVDRPGTGSRSVAAGMQALEHDPRDEVVVVFTRTG